MTVVTRRPTNPRSSLSQEFASVGLKSSSAFKVLPEWWEDALSHPTGVYELKGFAARHFGLEIGPDGILRKRSMPQARFKTRAGTDINEIATARAMATAVAGVVANVTSRPWHGSLPSAREIRSLVIGTQGRPWVALEDLLAICWERGVPVIYVPTLPITESKMDGMVTFTGGRPVILVTKKVDRPAWMIFVLGHEMGHLALGHVELEDGGTIVDEAISEESPLNDDPQEAEANRFSIEALTGGNNRTITLNRLIKAPQFASQALQFGRNHHIDPGHVVLNAVRNTRVFGKQPWALGQAALNYLPGNHTTADLCQSALKANIDLEALSDDSSEFLERLGVI